jgi:hypothetical protein
MKHVAPTPDPDAQPDAVTDYLAEVEQIANTPPEDFVDPQIEAQIERDNREAQLDKEEGGIFSRDPDADGLPTDEDIERGMQVDEVTEEDEGQQPTTQGVVEPDQDPLDKAVAALRAVNPKLSLKDAVALAEKVVNPDAPPAAEHEEVTPPPAVTDLKSELKSLKQEHRKLLRTYADDAEIDAIEARMDEIEENLLPAAEQYQVQQQAQVAQTFEHFAEQAVSLYPEAAQEGSALYTRMEQIHNDLEATGNPLVNAPDKALKIAQMAANELNIAPKRAGAAPAKTVTTNGTRSPAPMTRPIAGASQRTTTPTVPRVDQAIDAINSPEAWEKFVGVA